MKEADLLKNLAWKKLYYGAGLLVCATVYGLTGLSIMSQTPQREEVPFGNSPTLRSRDFKKLDRK